jgi:2-methylcitrate dehydratase PrpD
MDGTVYIPKGFAPAEPTKKTVEDAPRPVTNIMADFVHQTENKQLNDRAKTTLKNLIIDYIGVTAAATQKAESTGPVYEAISRLNGANGSYTVIGKD